VLQPEGLPLNPLRTIRPTTKQEFVALARVFADTMLAIQPRIGAVQRNEIVTAVTECFEAAGIFASSPSSWARPFPTLKDLQRHLESRGLAQGTPQGVLMDLVALGIFAEEDPPGEVDNLLDGVHIVNLKPLGSMPTVIRAVLCFFMNAFYGHMLRAGEAMLIRPEGSAHHLRALRRLVFVDEADDFISLGLHSLKNVMQQGRSFGCGVVLSTQFLHYFNRGDDPLRPLIGTWVLHQMSDLNASDVKALFGLSKGDADQLISGLSSLPKHTSLCVGLSSDAGRALSTGQPVEVRDLPFKEFREPESRCR
jgi:DNA phosphorothioation-dependent restriction protein DptH